MIMRDGQTFDVGLLQEALNDMFDYYDGKGEYPLVHLSMGRSAHCALAIVNHSDGFKDTEDHATINLRYVFVDFCAEESGSGPSTLPSIPKTDKRMMKAFPSAAAINIIDDALTKALLRAVAMYLTHSLSVT